MNGLIDHSSPTPQAAPTARTAAAKLHVLQLAPIKAKLAGKWPKLSELVHKLFEKAIRDAQGPRDHFLQLDELSYVVTFHGLALEEATLACAAIAHEVCEKLFGGAAASGISVRALVGQVSDDVLARQFGDGSEISDLLELNGREILISSNGASAQPSSSTTPGANDPDWEPINTIRKAHSALLPLGLETGLFPIWDLAKKTSSCVYTSAYSHAKPSLSCTRSLLAGTPHQVPRAEIALLYAAHAFSHRVRNAGRVCAVGASVSYGTLSDFNARIRYITALRSLTLPPECPVLLKLEEIPPGTPLGRLAELISMLAIPNLRFTLKFTSHLALPDTINIRLGAAGIGCGLPNQCDAALASAITRRLVQTFAAQKGFVFIEDLETSAAVDLAYAGGARFGTGKILNSCWFTGTDSVPTFPLRLA